MTVREWIKTYCVEHGLWDHEADGVIAAITESKHQAPLVEIFDKDIGGYPDTIQAVTAMVVNRAALAYIDEHKPMHFARPMFLPKAEREALLGEGGFNRA